MGISIPIRFCYFRNCRGKILPQSAVFYETFTKFIPVCYNTIEWRGMAFSAQKGCEMFPSWGNGKFMGCM